MTDRPTDIPGFTIRPGRAADTPLVLEFIRKLAEYEQLTHEVSASEAQLREMLFGERSYAEVLIGEEEGRPVGFALFFHNFSTFAGRPGLYLEDLFVNPEDRGKNYGKALMVELARLAVERGCARFEWSVLNWNEPSIEFYKSLGAQPMHQWTVFRLDGKSLENLGK